MSDLGQTRDWKQRCEAAEARVAELEAQNARLMTRGIEDMKHRIAVLEKALRYIEANCVTAQVRLAARAALFADAGEGGQG